jgi:hypothetical protein
MSMLAGNIRQGDLIYNSHTGMLQLVLYVSEPLNTTIHESLSGKTRVVHEVQITTFNIQTNYIYTSFHSATALRLSYVPLARKHD